MTEEEEHETVPDRLYRKVQSLVSTRRSAKPGGDLQILDQCVQLLVEDAGWEALPKWRLCLLENWSPGSVESAVSKAWFSPDLGPLEQRYDALNPDELIAMGRLGYKGHFGNQLFQYAWLRTYADSHGLVPATRYWIGRTLFGFDDPVYTEGKQLYKKNEFDLDMNVDIESVPDLPASNLYGFFQMHTSYWLPFRDRWRSLYTHTPEFQRLRDEAMLEIRQRGQSLVAIHIRQKGLMPLDSSVVYFHTEPDVYLSWLRENSEILEDAVLYIATDNPRVVEMFSEFQPMTSRDLKFDLPVLTFLPDWWVFQEADVVAIPNSTFSLTAAMLNEKAPRCFRISPDTQRLVSFDPWDTDVLLVKGEGSGWETSRQKYLEKREQKASRARGMWPRIKAGLRKLIG